MLRARGIHALPESSLDAEASSSRATRTMLESYLTTSNARGQSVQASQHLTGKSDTLAYASKSVPLGALACNEPQPRKSCNAGTDAPRHEPGIHAASLITIFVGLTSSQVLDMSSTLQKSIVRQKDARLNAA